jgi:hypothetical protein
VLSSVIPGQAENRAAKWLAGMTLTGAPRYTLSHMTSRTKASQTAGLYPTERRWRVEDAAKLANRDYSYVRRLLAQGQIKPAGYIQTQDHPRRIAPVLDDHALVDLLLKQRRQKRKGE